MSPGRNGVSRPSRRGRITDRSAAIRQAVLKSRSGDIVLIAGKGHETWQEARGRRIPFSDEALVRSALEDAA